MDNFDKQYIVHGPPGCGKTYYVARQCELAAETHGAESVMICSLTKTAAREASGRVNLPDKQVGTLHSFAWRGLGRPAIAEVNVEDFNDWQHEYRIAKQKNDLNIDAGFEQISTSQDDELLQDANLRRAKLQPFQLWPLETQSFYRLWAEWKEKNDYLDFQDLIENAVKECPDAPGTPKVIFFDEAQDASASEYELLRKWSRGATRVVTVGDICQSLYTWRGASPEVVFPQDTPTERQRILHQSYRVPRAVHEISLGWLSAMPGYREIRYEPTDAEGELCRIDAGYRKFHSILPAIEEDLAAGRSVMLQASCGFMLDPMISILRHEGIPFANPWRTSNGKLNPMGPRKGVTMPERILSFINEGNDFWTPGQFVKFAEVLKSKDVFKKGAKTRLKGINPNLSSIDLAEYMREIFLEDVIPYIANKDIGWWLNNLVSDKKRTAEFPIKALNRGGSEALSKSPKLYIGTIHSLKGSEADSVYLFPDLSLAGWREYRHRSQSVYRLFYVGMTRAKGKLTLCGPSDNKSVLFNV